MIEDIILKIKEEHKKGIAALEENKKRIEELADIITRSITSGNKVLIAGNGGSAADSQHLAAELVGRYAKERKGFPAIALSTDTSIITAVGNDYGFEHIFRRQVESLGKRGDIFIGISTSGNSKNVIEAITEAKKLGLITASLTGKDGGKIKTISDYNINIPLNETPRIQEFHSIVIHILAEMVENKLSSS